MPKIRSIVVGSGGIAQGHIRTMLRSKKTTRLVGFVEVNENSIDRTRETVRAENYDCPPFYGTIKELIAAQGAPDAAFICTPHKCHLENSLDCMKAGVDVFMEKPMVMNATEAKKIIQVRNKTRRLFVVAFPGSLSPAVQKAKRLIKAGKIGKVSAVAAFANQNWKLTTTGTWRQNEKISGGGFLFDTGSHMINTVVDLVGENVTEVAAMMDNRGTPVEIVSTVSGKTENGIFLSLTGIGDSIRCESQIIVFGDQGLLELGIWGGYLRIKSAADESYKDVPLKNPMGVWEQFVRVRQGKLENPCPAEVGLRFSKLMDMIRQSARVGKTVRDR